MSKINQLGRRTCAELEDLKIIKIEKEKERGYLIVKGMRLERPFKIYKNKYKMLLSYELKIKH